MRHKLTMANALSVLRIVLSVALLAPPALSPAFLAFYATAGLTDMLDGYVARRTKTESELGAKLDSVADLALTVVCLAKILPTVAVPVWLWVWVAIIAAVRVVNVASGLVMGRRLVMLHTTANKAAGAVAFLVPCSTPCRQNDEEHEHLGDVSRACQRLLTRAWYRRNLLGCLDEPVLVELLAMPGPPVHDEGLSEDASRGPRVARGGYTLYY